MILQHGMIEAFYPYTFHSKLESIQTEGSQDPGL